MEKQRGRKKGERQRDGGTGESVTKQERKESLQGRGKERKKEGRKEILACMIRMFPRNVWKGWEGKGKLLQKISSGKKTHIWFCTGF